ncbi:MAG: TonB family protein [Vicinamibacterales bacterium]
MVMRTVTRLLLAAWCLAPGFVSAHHGAAGSGAGVIQEVPPPKILKHVEPVYPEAAQRARIQGVVVVEATIGANGRVLEVRVMQSIPLLDQAALAAVRQWQYAPTIIGGVAKPVIMTAKVNFALKEPITATPMSAPVQRDWDKLSQTALKLVVDGRTTEAIRAVEKFLAAHPNIADVHFLLAGFYEQRTGFKSPPDAAQRRDLETAAKHYLRTSELLPDPAQRFIIVWKLAKLYDVDQLNDPVRAEQYARLLVDEYPARGESHMAYARLLRGKGDIAGAADVMRKGRGAASMPIPGLLLAMQYPIEHVQASRDLSRDMVRARLEEAIAAGDAILAHADKEQADYRLATMGKAMALELEAERVAPDRRRRIALLLESERWGAAIAEHKNGVPPPLRTLSPAAATELDWEYLRRWNSRLADAGGMVEAIAAYERYLAERPKFAPAHHELAELLIRAASEASDKAMATSRLEQAAAQLQQVSELATTPEERDRAFTRLLDLYRPKLLNRPAQEEATARVMTKRQPTVPAGHYALATVLLRTGRLAEGERVLRGARTAIKPAAPSRAAMAGELVQVILIQELPPDVARRLFDEAGELVAEAEKLNSNDVTVLESRMSWLNLSAERFEKDPGRAASQREMAKGLMERAQAIRMKKMYH